MSYSPPRIFISATAAGLRSVLEALKEALLSIGLVPVESASFESDWATVAGELRQKIESCDALIHVAGTRYGPEPDPATLPPGIRRRSYAQMQYDLGCEVQEQRGEGNFLLYAFVCAEDFPYDTAPGIEIAEKWSLQDAHRALLLKSPHFCGCPENIDDLRAWALGLRQQFPPPPEEPPQEPTSPQPQADVMDELPGQHSPDAAYHSEEMSTPADALQAASASPQRRSRLPLVLGILAATGVVALLAGALVLHQLGFLEDKFVLLEKLGIKTAPAVKMDSDVPPESKPATPAPKPPATPDATAASTPSALPPAPAVANPAPAVPAAPAPPGPPPSPAPSPSLPRTTEIDLVRHAALAADPASKLSASEIGKLYVGNPLYNGKTFTREDVVRQVDQFRSNWDTQTYEILEGPVVTSGAGTNRVIVKVKTRFVGLRKTHIQPSTFIVTSEYGVITSADGTPLIESIRELSREK